MDVWSGTCFLGGNLVIAIKFTRFFGVWISKPILKVSLTFLLRVHVGLKPIGSLGERRKRRVKNTGSFIWLLVTLINSGRNPSCWAVLCRDWDEVGTFSRDSWGQSPKWLHHGAAFSVLLFTDSKGERSGLWILLLAHSCLPGEEGGICPSHLSVQSLSLFVFQSHDWPSVQVIQVPLLCWVSTWSIMLNIFSLHLHLMWLREPDLTCFTHEYL